MAKTRRKSLKKLFAELKAVPPNVSSLEPVADGWRVTFFQQGGPGPSGLHTPVPLGATPSPATKLVPGTIFPDDDSPIDIADLTLNPPGLDDRDN